MASNFKTSMMVADFRAKFKAVLSAESVQLLDSIEYHLDHFLDDEAFENACDLIHVNDWEFDSPCAAMAEFMPIYSNISEIKDEVLPS
jgi:hypothetical protein